MSVSPRARAVSQFVVGTGVVLGVLLVAWGLWGMYVGIVNFDPQSGLPRWFAFSFAVPFLAVGVLLLVLCRSWVRKQRGSTGA
jgi:hypothetical protein